MAALVKKYPVGETRLSHGLLEGFTRSGSSLFAERGAGRHTAFLCRMDGAERGCNWGRFAFDARLPDSMALAVGAFASDEREFSRSGAITEFDRFLLDPDESRQNKLRLFQAGGGIRREGSSDILLTGLSGRYLWLYVELLGDGDAELTNFRVYSPEDNFFNTFPEIYRENGDFLRRYLAIFNSMYADFQETIDSLDRYLNLDTAPAGLLPVFAQWLGLELDGNFLEEAQLRRILKEAFRLISVKGTRAAVEGVAQALLDEPVTVVEPGLSDGQEVFRMEGRARPYDFAVLVNREADEKLHSRLKFLIDQFKPVRSRVDIIFLGRCGRLDTFGCLDVNAEIMQPGPGRIEKGAALNGLSYLQ